MNDLTKGTIRRFLKSLGVRVVKELYYKYEYDKENYTGLATQPTPVIFDVGANIGQSAVWFAKSFPTAAIHAFEPVPAVFRRLEKEVSGKGNIKTLNLACGEHAGTTYIAASADELVQTTQVLSKDGGHADGDEVTVTTVDDYCRANQIPSVHLLKTDTEGYDLDVLRGATGMLGAQSPMYILSEVTIFKDDPGHTNLFDLKAYLEPFGFTLVSFYDLHHDGNDGRLVYFNALFYKPA